MAREGHQRLSPRERECLLLVPELRTSKAIGARLGLRSATVDDYLKGAMRKLGALDRYAAATALLRSTDPAAPPPRFGVHQTPGVSEPAQLDDATADPESGDAISGAVRENASPYDAPPSEVRALWGKLAGPLTRADGAHNDLSTSQRLALCLRYGVLVLLAFSAFCVALLVFTAANHELRFR